VGRRWCRVGFLGICVGGVVMKWLSILWLVTIYCFGLYMETSIVLAFTVMLITVLAFFIVILGWDTFKNGSFS